MDIENREQLLTYLRGRGLVAAEEKPVFRTLPGGVSNRTVMVEFAGGQAWVIKQALEKLRVPTDWFSSPTRSHREALGLRWLEKLAPPGTITPLIFEDDKHHLLAMAAAPAPHANWKSLLLTGKLQEDHVRQFGQLLGQIHAQSRKQRAQLLPLFEDRSFFESLRLQPYYGFTAKQLPPAKPFLEQLIAVTRRQADCLVHGDFSPKNILIHDEKLILLDHEVVHFGDPAFDLGFSLAHLLSKAHHLQAMRNQFAAASLLYWRIYLEESGTKNNASQFEQRAVWHTLACLLARVAGQSQLEYLAEEERARQQEAVLKSIRRMPATIPQLVEQFILQLACP